MVFAVYSLSENRSGEKLNRRWKESVVPKEGIEPSCPRGQRFLRPPRLPIPPLRRKTDYIWERYKCQL